MKPSLSIPSPWHQKRTEVNLHWSQGILKKEKGVLERASDLWYLRKNLKMETYSSEYKGLHDNIKKNQNQNHIQFTSKLFKEPLTMTAAAAAEPRN